MRKPDTKSRTKRGTNHKGRDPVPELFESPEAEADFWAEHDLTQYRDYFREVNDVIVDLRNQPLRLESELAEKIGGVARRRGVSVETLVHLWLQQKLSEALKRDRRRSKRVSQKPVGAK